MVYAIILSGGTGERLGGTIPKQYIEVNGRPIIADCIDVFEDCEAVDSYIVVAMDEWQSYIRNLCGKKFSGFAKPGDNRQLSIYNGLSALKKMAMDDDIVIVHDAARPFVTKKTIEALLDGCKNSDGAMPALPVKDTMYIQQNGKVKALIDRNSLIAGQAPEAFKYAKYVLANEILLPDKILDIKGSAEPAFMAGMNITVVEGDERNYKITTKEDLDRYIKIKSY